MNRMIKTSRRADALRTFAVILVGGLFGAALTGIGLRSNAVRAAADGNLGTDNLSRVFPYEGRLERDGVGYDGNVSMRFTVLDADGTVVLEESWTQTQIGSFDIDLRIPVYDGAFSALIGALSSVGTMATVASAPAPLRLTVAVDTGDGWEELSGAQELHATPFALWTATSRQLVVGGNLSASSAAFDGAVDVAADVAITSGSAQIGLGIDASDNSATGRHAIVLGSGARIAWDMESNTLGYYAGADVPDSEDASTSRWALDLDYGDMRIGGNATFGAASTINADLSVAGGEFTVNASSPTVTLGTGGNAIGFAGATMSYTSGSSDYWSLSAGGGTDLRIYPADGTFRSYEPTKVGGDLVLENIRTLSNDGEVKSNLDKAFLGDSSCTEGELTSAFVSSGPALCACFQSGTLSHGKGWYCWY